jgi:hypothetical protein
MTLPTDFANRTLTAADMIAYSKQIMASNLAHGKGVTNGLNLSPGPSPSTVHVTAGGFGTQIHTDVALDFDATIPHPFEGYLWIQAGNYGTSPPNVETTPTSDDFDSNWVCLGAVSSDSSGAVTVDESNGRMLFGNALMPALGQYVGAAVQDYHETVVQPMIAAQIQAAVPQYRTETPTGPVDGANKTFALSFAPLHGGLTLTIAAPDSDNTSDSGPDDVGDYTLTGSTIVFDMAPPVGTLMRAQYPYLNPQ